MSVHVLEIKAAPKRVFPILNVSNVGRCFDLSGSKKSSAWRQFFLTCIFLFRRMTMVGRHTTSVENIYLSVPVTPDTLFPNYCFNQNLLSGSTQLGLDNVCHLMFTNECLLPNTLEPNKIIFLLLNGQGHTKTFIWIVIQVYFHEIIQKQAFRSLAPETECCLRYYLWARGSGKNTCEPLLSNVFKWTNKNICSPIPGHGLTSIRYRLCLLLLIRVLLYSCFQNNRIEYWKYWKRLINTSLNHLNNMVRVWQTLLFVFK